jgi:predicted Rossmann fold nucleotide-binding protein DprA/Smf involved in DNA uptake
MKLIVAGGRDFNSYSMLADALDHLLSQTDEEVTIVSGKARGPDTLALQYAKENGLEAIIAPAD